MYSHRKLESTLHFLVITGNGAAADATEAVNTGESDLSASDQGSVESPCPHSQHSDLANIIFPAIYICAHFCFPGNTPGNSDDEGDEHVQQPRRGRQSVGTCVKRAGTDGM